MEGGLEPQSDSCAHLLEVNALKRNPVKTELMLDGKPEALNAVMLLMGLG